MTAQPLTLDQPGPRADGVLKYARIGELTLENGQVLPDVTLAYETWGQLNETADNVILVLHALTGDTHVSRGVVTEEMDDAARAAASHEGWWAGIVGPGCVIDTNRYFVLAPNMLGGCYGSTGPSSPAPDGKPYGSRFPQITIRDSVAAERILLDQLGIRSLRYVIGASLGGARSIEWAATYPELVEGCAVVASGHSATGDQLAWAQTQNLAIRSDPAWAGGDYYGSEGPVAGLGIARRIAHTTYRSAPELNYRFGRQPQGEEKPLADFNASRGRYEVESYLDHQAEKFVHRFDANSYLAINEALMTHDVTRGRGTLKQTLGRTHCNWLIAYVDTDRLFFPSESMIIAAEAPGNVEAHAIRSPCGHDGFLIETDQVEALLRRAFAEQDERLARSVGYLMAGA